MKGRPDTVGSLLFLVIGVPQIVVFLLFVGIPWLLDLLHALML